MILFFFFPFLVYHFSGTALKFYFTTLLYDGLYVMIYIGQTRIPQKLQDIKEYVNGCDVLLDAFDIYHRLCHTIEGEEELSNLNKNKKGTLGTPEFNRVVSNNKNRKRTCNLMFH